MDLSHSCFLCTVKNQSVLLPPAGQSKRNIHPSKILRSIIDVVSAIDLHGTIVYISPSAIELYGYSDEELTGRSFADHILPEDIEYCYTAMQQGLEGIQGSNWESRIVHKNGTVIPVICSGRWDEEDQLFYCVLRNGSEKKAIEDRLNKARQQARIAHFEFDFTGKQQHYFSENFFEILGISRDKERDFDFDSMQRMVHPDDRAMVLEHDWSKHISGDQTIDYRIMHPDGSISFINRAANHHTDDQGRLVRLVGTVQDITDRKLTELALQQSEARFRALIEYGHAITGIINSEGLYTYLSDNVETQVGYKKKDMLGTSGFDYIHPDDIEMMAVTLSSSLDKDVCESPAFRFRNAKGEWRWMELTLVNLLNNPTVKGLVVQSRDITEKKQKDEALELSEQKFKSLVENSADLVAIMDEQGSFTYVSENVTPLLGYDPAEIIGHNVVDFLGDEDREKVAAEIFKVHNGLSDGKGIQHRFRHKNGEMMWFESKGKNLYSHNSIKGIMVNTRNIDERVRLQEKLNQEEANKQKEITAAVIKAQETERSQLGLELHDNVNQVLTTVKLYNEMYLTGYVQDKNLLVKSTQYTQDCINEIRSISKRLSAPTLGNISLRDSIRDLVDSINITRRLEIIYCAEQLTHTNVSEDLHLAIYRIVQEGLNNILKYAKAKSAWVRLELAEEGISLVIADDGVGFDTSKKRGGIGITNMMTRAENVNAKFSLVSAPGEGCEIRIVFPV